MPSAVPTPNNHRHRGRTLQQMAASLLVVLGVGSDGSQIYKPAGRINNAGRLRGMVEMCNTTMNLGLFPEDVLAVAAVLNRDHYKFK